MGSNVHKKLKSHIIALFSGFEDIIKLLYYWCSYTHNILCNFSHAILNNLPSYIATIVNRKCFDFRIEAPSLIMVHILHTKHISQLSVINLLPVLSDRK